MRPSAFWSLVALFIISGYLWDRLGHASQVIFISTMALILVHEICQAIRSPKLTINVNVAHGSTPQKFQGVR
jgi:hypothetical protein